MSSFKKTPVHMLTNASVVTSEEVEYWQELGVSFDLGENVHRIYFSFHFRNKSS